MFKKNKIIGIIFVISITCLNIVFVLEEIHFTPCVSSFTQTTPSKLSVNLNTATKKQLMTLKGVGEELAQKIIDFRTKNRSFTSVYDLYLVAGIGEELVKANINSIRVE